MNDYSDKYLEAEATLAYIDKVARALQALLDKLCDYSYSGICVRADDFDVAVRCINDAVADLFYEEYCMARRVIEKEDKEQWQRFVEERKPKL